MAIDPETPQDNAEPAQLRFLRRLVTVLTIVMILGLLTIVTLIVIRMFQPARVGLPENITLPAGTEATAFTHGDGWYAIVTNTQEILIFSASSGVLVQTIPIEISN